LNGLREVSQNSSNAHRAQGVKRRWLPAVVLLVLSPAIGELLSGSSPPKEFFNPVTFLTLAGLYGSGAILVRELTLRWQKGWPTLLVLAAAYGIVEEGLMCKSFFDPNWPDVGILGVYGHWLGVNWVWAEHLTFFHTAFSIAIPILLVEMIYAQRRHDSWVSARVFRLLLYVMLFVVALGFCFFPSAEKPFLPPPLGYGLTVVVVLVLLFWSRRLPACCTCGHEYRGVARPGRFSLVGLLGTVLFFAIFWILPKTATHPLVTIGWGAALPGAAVVLVLRMSGGGMRWDDSHRLALVSGAVGFLVLLAPLQELDNPNRPDDTTGMSYVGCGMLLLLWWVLRRIRSRCRQETRIPETQAPSESAG
jgi:hypothetical protein